MAGVAEAAEVFIIGCGFRAVVPGDVVWVERCTIPKQLRKNLANRILANTKLILLRVRAGGRRDIIVHPEWRETTRRIADFRPEGLAGAKNSAACV
jgi:hypothetical protein